MVQTLDHLNLIKCHFANISKVECHPLTCTTICRHMVTPQELLKPYQLQQPQHQHYQLIKTIAEATLPNTKSQAMDSMSTWSLTPCQQVHRDMLLR